MKNKRYKKLIIDYIKKNRVSTTEVADCLNKTGAILNVRAVSRSHFRVGTLFWGYAHGETNWSVHEQIQNVKEGDIVFIEVFDCKDRAIFGDLVSKYLILYKQAAAIVVQGNLRDAHRLVKENWPIWCSGFSPIGCFNTIPDDDLDSNIIKERKKKYQGAIAICDDSGVVVISKEHHNEEFLKKLEFIEQQEDIWYDCIDRKKWSTYETVCLKNYLKKKSK
ncbi:MAG: RraA family protein [Deltaproteobacteria bacterium]